MCTKHNQKKDLNNWKQVKLLIYRKLNTFEYSKNTIIRTNEGNKKNCPLVDELDFRVVGGVQFGGQLWTFLNQKTYRVCEKLLFFHVLNFKPIFTGNLMYNDEISSFFKLILKVFFKMVLKVVLEVILKLNKDFFFKLHKKIRTKITLIWF